MNCIDFLRKNDVEEPFQTIRKPIMTDARSRYFTTLDLTKYFKFLEIIQCYCFRGFIDLIYLFIIFANMLYSYNFCFENKKSHQHITFFIIRKTIFHKIICHANLKQAVLFNCYYEQYATQFFIPFRRLLLQAH